MAQSNKILLCGIQQKDTRVNEDGSYASFILKTTIGPRNDGVNKRYRYIYTVIISRDPDIIKKMADTKENDLIYIKGVIVTRNVKKVSYCTVCKTENITDGQIVYCEPIYLERLKSVNKEDAQAVLAEHEEISNEARIIGNVCADPISITDKRGKKSTKYHLAITRSYRLKNSTEDEKTDFPVVHSYGDNAAEDMLHIKEGTRVFIDGYLQGYKKDVPVKCCGCGLEYIYKDARMEIIPYETEYLKDLAMPEK